MFQWKQQNYCRLQALFNCAEILYESCEKFNLPITVMFDDQGSFY